jgi:hypothetical protein
MVRRASVGCAGGHAILATQPGRVPATAIVGARLASRTNTFRQTAFGNGNRLGSPGRHSPLLRGVERRPHGPGNRSAAPQPPGRRRSGLMPSRKGRLAGRFRDPGRTASGSAAPSLRLRQRSVSSPGPPASSRASFPLSSVSRVFRFCWAWVASLAQSVEWTLTLPHRRRIARAW